MDGIDPMSNDERDDERAAAESQLPLTHIVYHILVSLSGGERHGYGIIKDVLDRTGGQLEIEAGTLYAAIKRLRDDGVIEEVASPAGSDARRRYYAVTPFGRHVLGLETRRLEALVQLARDAEIRVPGAS